jgi:hypothetical protein
MRRMLLAPLAAPLVISGTLLAAAPERAGAPTVVSFEAMTVGSVPSGFKVLTSAEREPGKWQVVKLGDKAALAQVDVGRAGYRIAALESAQLEQLRAGTELRMGPGDRAAGIAWRVRDAANYYAARLDLAENEFVLYKFVRGNRIRLARLSNLRLPVSDWHQLSIEHNSERIRVWLNGIPVASERDDALPEPGMVGLWMPGDSTAQFKRLWFEPIRRD